MYFSVVDVDVSSKSEVPECYKSQLIVTLSNAENKDTEYIIHSNMLNSDVSVAGIDNPAFAESEMDNVKVEGQIETDSFKCEGQIENDIAKDEDKNEIGNFKCEGQIETDNSKCEGQTDDDKDISVLEQTDINKQVDVERKINSDITIDDDHQNDDDKETGGDKLVDIDQHVDKQLDKQSDNDKHADDDKQNYTYKHYGGGINNGTDITNTVGDIISIGTSKF